MKRTRILTNFDNDSYISLSSEKGGRALIGAWGLKETNTVLHQYCHPLALLTIKDKDLQGLNFLPYNLQYI